MKRSAVIVLIALFSLNSFGQAANENKKAFSLQEALDFAMTNSANLRIGELNEDRAKQEIVNTASAGLPQVRAIGSFQHFPNIPTQVIPDFFGPAVTQTLIGYGLIPPDVFDPNADPNLIEAQFGTEFNTSYGVSADQLIFDGRYFYGLKASKAYAHYVQIENDKIERDVEDNVLIAYYSALAAKQNLLILMESKKNIDKSLAETTAFFDMGFVEELDVDQLKLMKSTVDASLKDAENRLETAKTMLKFHMGFPVEKEIELTDELESILNMDQANALLTESVNPDKHLDMKLLDQGLELQEIGLRVEQSNYAPTLRAFFSHTENNFGNELDLGGNWFPNTVWGVNLNIPLFTSFGTRSKVQMSKIDIDKINIQKQQLDQSLRLQASNSKSEYFNALSQYQNEKENLELAEKIRNKTAVKFKAGMSSSLELTQAETQLLQTQGRYIGAMYNLLSSKIQLEQALGK